MIGTGKGFYIILFLGFFQNLFCNVIDTTEMLVRHPFDKDVSFPSCFLTPWGQVKMSSCKFSSLVLSCYLLCRNLRENKGLFERKFHKASLTCFCFILQILREWFFPYLFGDLQLHLALGKKKSFQSLFLNFSLQLLVFQNQIKAEMKRETSSLISNKCSNFISQLSGN